MVQNILKNKIAFETTKNLSNLFKNLVSKLLHKDYKLRLKAEDALQHNWFKPVIEKLVTPPVVANKTAQSVPNTEILTKKKDTIIQLKVT